ncbi:MAG: hypothetical protein EAZ20_01205 [Bacteroidetes bacterium]|nr:MAG: hypothetical protein EAZ20_01205 [Bacteroidota bacterium]
MKKYSFLLFILFFLFLDKKIIAQDTYIFPKANIGFHRGGLYTDLQIGYAYSPYKSGFGLFEEMRIVSVGVESNYFFKNDFRLTPKICLEYQKGLLLWAIQGRLYPAKNMDFKQASIQICPQVGISIFSTGYISFGYSFGLNNRDITSDLGFQANLGFNLLRE